MEEKQLKESFDQPFVLPAAGKRSGVHQWVPGSDVQSLWRRHGWTPPSEKKRELNTPAEMVKHPPLRIVRG